MFFVLFPVLCVFISYGLFNKKCKYAFLYVKKRESFDDKTLTIIYNKNGIQIKENWINPVIEALKRGVKTHPVKNLWELTVDLLVYISGL